MSASLVLLDVGGTRQLTASAHSASGTPLPDQPMAWRSTNSAVASVSDRGLVTAVRDGSALVIATSGNAADTAEVTVVGPSDYSVLDAQITQAVQSPAQLVPMVAGSPAAVNVQLIASPFRNVQMQIVLRLTDDAGSPLRADTVLARPVSSGSAGFEAPNAQFLIPASLVRAGVRWQVVRDPRGLVRDSVAANDVFPREGPRAISAVTVSPPAIRFVPIRLNSHQGVTGIVNAALAPSYLLMLNAVYPIGAPELSVAAPLSTDASFVVGGVVGAASFWSTVLAELDLARVLDATNPSAYWYGVVPPPAATSFPAGMLTGMAFTPSDGAATGAGTRTAVGIQAGWPGFQNQATLTVAHEIGHTFGRRHAPCATSTDELDPNYPHSGGVTGEIGHNVYMWSNGGVAGAPAFAPTTLDIMAPCGIQRWVSEYTYRGVLTFRGVAAAVSLPQDPAAHALIVRGSVSPSGDVVLEPAFVTTARSTRPEHAGQYRLRVTSVDGALLYTAAFAPSALGDAHGVGHFLFSIPLTSETQIGAIEVTGPNGIVRRTRSLALPSALEPSVARIAPDRARITCADPSTRGALVRDADTGALLGIASARSASVNVRPGHRIHIICSDGFGSTTKSAIVQ
jgi:hypothetical protein